MPNTTLTLESPCKVNWVLNILGKRSDGFHELESLMIPVPLCDQLLFDREPAEFRLSCNQPSLPVDASNLVHKAAMAFFSAATLAPRGSIHLEKKIPMAAGLGGGSGNAAVTLLGLNQIYGHPLSESCLFELAEKLGSDVPFFLAPGPALAVGRGEKVERLAPFKSLQGAALLLVHPGFGVSTPWAYQALGRFPVFICGKAGRAAEAATVLSTQGAERSASVLFNSLEAPVLEKHPILRIYQTVLMDSGALGALMSGSGSTTFALFDSLSSASKARELFDQRFTACWTQVVPL